MASGVSTVRSQLLRVSRLYTHLTKYCRWLVRHCVLLNALFINALHHDDDDHNLLDDMPCKTCEATSSILKLLLPMACGYLNRTTGLSLQMTGATIIVLQMSPYWTCCIVIACRHPTVCKSTVSVDAHMYLLAHVCHNLSRSDRV